MNMMSESRPQDPYLPTPQTVETPPTTLWGALRRVGPGLILASAIVGSGELIATTVLGAEFGYSLLWLILLSCVIKIVVQHEMGRYAIATGETALESFDRVRGPRWRVSWVVWLWFAMLLLSIFAVGGMLGAIGEVLHMIFPAVSITAWVWIVNLATIVLLIFGRYSLVEHVSMGLVASFTVLTVSCAAVLLKSPQYFSWADVAGGLSFSLPEGGLVTAIAVFGITGVGASELVIYPYWCIEKGYARFAGPQDGSPGWKRRAEGWVGVMGVDIISSLLIYTVSTVAFYLLGAGVLHGMGVVPVGSEMVDMLSNMFTATLGPSSRLLFLAGAVAVFYSTVFAATAAHSRLCADFVSLIGVFDKRNYAARLIATRISVVVLLGLPATIFMFIREPVVMVTIGGVAEALMLPVIAFSTVYLHHIHLPKSIVPKGWITLALWITSAVMLLMMGYSIVLQLLG